MFTYKKRLRSKGNKFCWNYLLHGVIFSFLLFSLASTSFGQDAGKKVFETKCYSCHSVGGGDKQGPDLKGVTTRRSKEWLEEFIKSPTSMSAKDADAAALFKKYSPEVMADQTLTQEEMDAVINMIKTLSANNETFVPSGAKLSRAIETNDYLEGWKLFTGQTRFENGGVSCNSCHAVKGLNSFGGGTLGPDLTAVNVKYSDPELILILQEPNFPTMAKMFKDHKLNDEEIVQLMAYFQNSKGVNPEAPVVKTVPSGTIEPRFLIVGFLATILVVVGFNLLIWRNRHSNVRRDIVEGAKHEELD